MCSVLRYRTASLAVAGLIAVSLGLLVRAGRIGSQSVRMEIESDEASQIEWPDDPIEFPEDELLTVEETVGLTTHSDTLSVHLARRGNPEARQQLWNLIDLNDEGLFALQGKAFLILGYVGNDEDAQRMVNMLQKATGILNIASSDQVKVIIAALGKMAFRGVATARKNLDEMSDVTYWQGRFQYVPERIRSEGKLPPELETLVNVLRTQARSKREAYPALCARVLSRITNKQHRERVAGEIDPKYMRRCLTSLMLAEQEKPTELERKSLQKMYARRDELMEVESRAMHKMWDKSDSWYRLKPAPK